MYIMYMIYHITNVYIYIYIYILSFEKETGGIGNRGKNRDYSDPNIIKIGKNI